MYVIHVCNARVRDKSNPDLPDIQTLLRLPAMQKWDNSGKRGRKSTYLIGLNVR
jgi:hypothetical protein